MRALQAALALASLRVREEPAAASAAPWASSLPLKLEKLSAGKTCALVSSSDALLRSADGTAIDAHDVVARVNFPSLAGFEAHVGRRTSVVLSGWPVIENQKPELLGRLDEFPPGTLVVLSDLTCGANRTHGEHPGRPHILDYSAKCESAYHRCEERKWECEQVQPDTIDDLALETAAQGLPLPSTGFIAAAFLNASCACVTAYGFSDDSLTNAKFGKELGQDRITGAHYWDPPEKQLRSDPGWHVFRKEHSLLRNLRSCPPAARIALRVESDASAKITRNVTRAAARPVSLLDVAAYPALHMLESEWTVGEGWSKRAADDPAREWRVLETAFARDHPGPVGWRKAVAAVPRFMERKRLELTLFAGVLLALLVTAAWTLRGALTVTDGALVLVYFAVCITSDATTVIMTSLYGLHAGYSKLSLVAVVEFVKLFVSLGLVALERQPRAAAGALKVPDVLWMGGSAALYAASNYLFFLVLERLDPSIFAIVRETSILWLCLIYSCVFGRGLGRARWAYASLTVVACMVVHLPSLRQTRRFDPSVLPALLLTCTSCAAAVVNEKALKMNRALSINQQNALLYSLCGFLTLLAGIAMHGGSFGWHFFDGFERWILWVIACQALMGLICSRILKAAALGSTAKAVLTAFRPFILLFAVPVFMPSATYSVLAICAGTVASLGSFGFLAQGPLSKISAEEEEHERTSSDNAKSSPALNIATSLVLLGAASGAAVFGFGLRQAFHAHYH